MKAVQPSAQMPLAEVHRHEMTTEQATMVMMTYIIFLAAIEADGAGRR